jgi:Skp family chaperone for outer membrane proteins
LTRYAFQKYIRAVLVVVSLGVLFGLSSPEARAQGTQPATGPKFGSVDVQRIMNESKARQRDGAELQQLVGSLREVMQKLQDSSARFLTEPEIKELAGLFEKKMPTEAEKKRISQLTDAAAIKSSTMRRLENTANATPEESKQLTDLTAAAQKGQEALKNLGGEFQRRLEAREVDLNNKTVTEIKTIIGKIAQEKGLVVVFDSAVAIYTANDITDDVIKQINK